MRIGLTSIFVDDQDQAERLKAKGVVFVKESWRRDYLTDSRTSARSHLWVAVGHRLLAFTLIIVFSFTFEWVFIATGLYAGNAQAAQGMAFILVPFTFVSSAYVPVSSMPGGLRAVAEHQPVTYMIDAVRSLTGGQRAEALLGHPASYSWLARWSGRPCCCWCSVRSRLLATAAGEAIHPLSASTSSVESRQVGRSRL
jgi:hypothetical protein